MTMATAEQINASIVESAFGILTESPMNSLATQARSDLYNLGWNDSAILEEIKTRTAKPWFHQGCTASTVIESIDHI